MEEIGHLGALAIAFSQLRSKSLATEKVHEAHEACVQQIGRLSDKTGSDDTLQQLARRSRPSLNLFLSEAADLLGGRMCALFTPDAPIEISATSRARSTTQKVACRRSILPAGRHWL